MSMLRKNQLLPGGEKFVCRIVAELLERKHVPLEAVARCFRQPQLALSRMKRRELDAFLSVWKVSQPTGDEVDGWVAHLKSGGGSKLVEAILEDRGPRLRLRLEALLVDYALGGRVTQSVSLSPGTKIGVDLGFGENIITVDELMNIARKK